MGMILPRSGRCAALLAAPALVLLLVAPARAAAHFRPCPGRAAFECATVRVPLDHSGRVKGTIGLHVERRRGTGGRSVAWIGLAGGPGESSTITGYPLWKRLAGPVAARDQVVLFDQRGTGRSGAIDCTRAYQQARTRAGGGTLCGRRLGHKRPFYTTGASVQDIESVRRAVGAGRVELVGVSYGTYVALRYARAHPERTAGLVLDSTVPLTGVDQWNRSTFAAVPRILAQLCAGGACPDLRDPVADTATVVRRLADRPRGARLIGPTGQYAPQRISGPQELWTLLDEGDFDPFSRAFVPGAIAAARHGDWAPLVRLSALATGGSDGSSTTRAADEPTLDQADSQGLFLATTCTDVALPWPAGAATGAARGRALHAALGSLTPAAFAPFDMDTVRRTSAGETCRGWPATRVRAYRDPGTPLPVPALILSGSADLRTPTEDAVRTRALLSGSTLVVVPGAGHSTLALDTTGCARTAYRRFVTGAAVGHPCDRPGVQPATQPMPPRDLAGVAAVGAPGVAGRLSGVTVATVRDALAVGALMAASRGTPDVEFGGLRSGRARGTSAGRSASLGLRRYAYLAGVRVSGTVRLTADGIAARVTVDGGRASRRGSWDGNVYKPDAFRPPTDDKPTDRRKPH